MNRTYQKKNQRYEQGTVLLLAAITILVVVGMLALAVDIGYMMNGRGQLQNAVDAAALAGAQGSHAAIEPPGSSTQTSSLVRQLANQYAGLNSVRKVGDSSPLKLSEADITFDFPSDYPVHQPRILVKHRTTLPTIFANVFGFSNFTVSAGAIASTTFVDGGTGMISSCWRPILIPDTFFDANNEVWAIGTSFKSTEPTALTSSLRNCAKQLPDGTTLQYPCEYPREDLGDFYISRFASVAGSRSGSNYDSSFVYPPNTNILSGSTSIRDTKNNTDLKYLNGVKAGRNLIGQRIILRPTDYLVVDFANSSGITGEIPGEVSQQIEKGCCVPIRVGQPIKVFPQYDTSSWPYPAFWSLLSNYISSLRVGYFDSPEAAQYRYAKSQRFPTPNANPTVLPVLMCNPFKFSKNMNQAYVTNIGAFHAEAVASDGTMVGYFVREVVTSGTPLQKQDEVPNISQLPVSVSLIR